MIRNFIYSDSDKIRSISSQIFEGVSERVVHSHRDTREARESQKGPVGSGKLLGDIFSTEKSTSELRFLEDYAYSILEDKLIEDKFVDLFDSNIEFVVTNKSFVKVKSVLRLNDLRVSSKTLSGFNELGEAFWRVTNEPMGPNQSNNRIASDGEARKKAGEAGLQLNKKVADSAAQIIDFGFGDLIEANMVIHDTIFSAPLKRSFFRESEQLILHKYSRVSQQEFIMLGIVTQLGTTSEGNQYIPEVKDADGIKEAMRTLSLHLRDFEKVFSAPAKNEIIVDPIAIYSLL